MKLFALLLCYVLIFPIEIFAQYPVVKVNTSDNQPEEMAITINPKQINNLIAGSNIDNYYYSSDGGNTWQEGQLASQYGVWGDPSITADSLGNIYFAHLSTPPNGHWIDRIVVQKSKDGGKTWDDGVGIGLNGSKQQDKEWLAVDLTNSIYKNNLYIAWTEFDKYGSSDPADSTRILFSRSTDHGQHWSHPIRISDRGGDCRDSDNTVEGAVPAVGPEGQIYISWSGPLGIMFDRSFDGGKTFGKDIFVASQPGGWGFNIPGINRCNGMPITLCDISNSANRGTIYVIWSDQRNGTNNTDIFLTKSRDEGTTWTAPIRVNTDHTQTQQFLPWAAIDQSNGNIYVVFYDRRNYTDNRTDVYLAVSTDGGNSFTNSRISQSPFLPNSTVFFGDYINIAASHGRIYPIWMRMDYGSLSARAALIQIQSVVFEKSSKPTKFFLSQNYPNPFNSGTTIEFQIPARERVTIKVFNLKGQIVAAILNQLICAGTHRIKFNASSWSSGIYFYKISAGKYSSTKQMILLK